MPCEVTHTERKIGIPRCLPFYNNDHQDTTPYNKPGWIPVRNVTSLLSNITNLDSLCPKPWQYLTADELKTDPLRGKMATYSGGGYVANLGYNSESALDVIESLEQGHWIDDKTVAVLVECTFFEPSTSLFSILNYLYERYPTGGIITSSKIKTMTVYLPQGSNSYQLFYQACQVVLTLVIVIFAIMEIAEVLRGACVYFKRFWSWVEITLISFASAAVVIMLDKDKYTRKYVKNVRTNPFENWSVDQIARWSEIEDYLLACVMFIITVKSLRLIRFNPHIYQMRKTLTASITPLCSFSSVFFVIILAFASFGYMTFGSSVIEYSSISDAIRSLLQMLIGGKSSYYQLKVATESSLGPIFLFVYLIAAVALLLHLFVAILDESYSASREESIKAVDEMDYVDIFLYVWSCAKSTLYYLYNFHKFFRESFRYGKSRRKPPKNRYKTNGVKSGGCAPRLASMDSLHEIQHPRASLERADEMISEVIIHLTKFYDNTVQEDEENSDIDHDSEEINCYASQLDLNSECDSFLEGGLLRSSISSLNFSESFHLDNLSLESNV